MKRAVSSLAWSRDNDESVARLLTEFDIDAIEIAPTTRWRQPTLVTDAALNVERQTWLNRGVRIVALQSLLYGHDDATIFGDPHRRAATLEYLRRIIHLGAQLGATILVFGSPKLRCPGDLEASLARRIAVEFFGELGRSAQAMAVQVCIEPVPRSYGCEFVTNAAEGGAFVREVAQPGLGLHLDAGAMTLAGDTQAHVLAGHAADLQHFHCSEAMLAPLGQPAPDQLAVDHACLGRGLPDIGYAGYCSLEMRTPQGPNPIAQLRRAMAVQREHYGIQSTHCWP